MLDVLRLLLLVQLLDDCLLDFPFVVCQASGMVSKWRGDWFLLENLINSGILIVLKHIDVSVVHVVDCLLINILLNRQSKRRLWLFSGYVDACWLLMVHFSCTILHLIHKVTCRVSFAFTVERLTTMVLKWVFIDLVINWLNFRKGVVNYFGLNIINILSVVKYITAEILVAIRSLVQKICPFGNTALGSDNWVDAASKDGHLDSVFNEIGSFRHFEEDCILVPVSKLAHKSSFDFILTLSPFVVSIIMNCCLILDCVGRCEESILVD